MGGPALRQASGGDVSDEDVDQAGSVEALGTGETHSAQVTTGGGSALLAQPDDGRELIYTANLSVRVSEPTKAANDATAITTAAGGHVFSARTAAEGDSQLVLRVPPDRLDEVLEDLADLGRESDRSLNAEDVTDRVVDLEARTVTAKASVERLRALLGEAANVPEVVSIESELTKRETELESLTGQQRQLADRVDLATVHLGLHRRAGPEPSDDIPSFLDGLRTGGAALVNAARVAATVAGFLLPFTVVLLAVGVPLLALWRRRRQARNAFPPLAP